MVNDQRFEKILNFLETIDKFKMIYRCAYLSDSSRQESDAEHTWHMSMFALLLYPELKQNIDINRVLHLILIHDLVEIYAGDTFAYDKKSYLDKKEREDNAASQLFSLLPEDSQTSMYILWQEFEEGLTPEAQFAQAMDKLQAFAQNVFNSGRIWHERSVTEEMSRNRNRTAMAFNPVLNDFFEVLYQRAAREKLWNCTK